MSIEDKINQSKEKLIELGKEYMKHHNKSIEIEQKMFDIVYDLTSDGSYNDEYMYNKLIPKNSCYEYTDVNHYCKYRVIGYDKGCEEYLCLVNDIGKMKDEETFKFISGDVLFTCKPITLEEYEQWATIINKDSELPFA